MGKARSFICNGPHRIMRTQAQVPHGWKLVRVWHDALRSTLAWFCPKCLETECMSREKKT